jgi:hypothetical protein
LGTQSSAGSFVSPISGLLADTTYFYRAYATNGTGTAYGSILSFTTGDLIPRRHMRLFEGFRIILYEGGRLKLNQQ